MARKSNAYIFAPTAKRRKGPGCLLFFLVTVVAAVVLSLIGNATLNRKMLLASEKIPVMALDKAFESFSVLHVSDLHAADIGTDANAWRELLYGKRVDAIVLTGDMVGRSGNYEPMIGLIHALKAAKAASPIYFVAGDDDPTPLISAYRGTPEVYADWVLAAQEAGAVYLDAPVSQPMGKGTVWFVPEYLYSVDAAGMASSLSHQKGEMETKGVQYEAEGGANYRVLLARLSAMERSAEAIKTIKDQDLQIAVTHVPLEVDYVRMALEWAPQDIPFSVRRISLVMAGHYTGGQWRFFGLGPVYVPEVGWFPGDTSLVGLQRINSLNQYVTAGLGASSFYPMPGRLFNPPSVALLTFTARIQ